MILIKVWFDIELCDCLRTQSWNDTGVETTALVPNAFVTWSEEKRLNYLSEHSDRIRRDIERNCCVAFNEFEYELLEDDQTRGWVSSG